VRAADRAATLLLHAARHNVGVSTLAGQAGAGNNTFSYFCRRAILPVLLEEGERQMLLLVSVDVLWCDGGAGGGIDGEI
jgi:hypothetical protein